MAIVLLCDFELEIPKWVTNRAAYRRWVHSPAVPEKLKTYWVGGDLWVDLSKEQIFTHGAVKGEFHRVLRNLVEQRDLGNVLLSGALFSNDAADISVDPDVTFISYRSRENGRVEFVRQPDGGCAEFQGTPDMVMEAVSNSSVRKDTCLLLEGYWAAGIPEYWLVDARKSPARFDIYRHTREGYIATRRRDGWLKSLVFGNHFRLVESKDRFGTPEYRLEVK